MRRPEAGKAIPGTGGLRKVRWAASGRGKRGGARIIYFWLTSRSSSATPPEEVDKLDNLAYKKKSGWPGKRNGSQAIASQTEKQKK